MFMMKIAVWQGPKSLGRTALSLIPWVSQVPIGRGERGRVAFLFILTLPNISDAATLGCNRRKATDWKICNQLRNDPMIGNFQARANSARASRFHVICQLQSPSR